MLKVVNDWCFEMRRLEHWLKMRLNLAGEAYRCSEDISGISGLTGIPRRL